MVQVSFTLPMAHSQGRRGRRRPAGQQDGHGSRAGGAREADGAGLHVLRRLRTGAPPGRPATGRGRRAGLPAAHAQGGQRRGQAGPAPPAGRRRRLHRHRRAHGRHRRDPEHQGLRRREGPGVLPRAARWSTSVPRSRCPSWSGGRSRRRPTPYWSPRWSPSATRTCSTPGRCRRRSERRSRRRAGRCWSSAGRASTRRWPQSSASTGSSRRGTTPGEVASYLVHRLGHRREGTPVMSRTPAAAGPRSPTAATCRTRTPTTQATSSTAPTALGLFGDAATEMCIATDGDEGLFASYSDVQFRAPCEPATSSRSRARLVRVGTPLAESSTSPRWSSVAAHPRPVPSAAPHARPSRWSPPPPPAPASSRNVAPLASGGAACLARTRRRTRRFLHPMFVSRSPA